MSVTSFCFLYGFINYQVHKGVESTQDTNYRSTAIEFHYNIDNQLYRNS